MINQSFDQKDLTITEIAKKKTIVDLPIKKRKRRQKFIPAKIEIIKTNNKLVKSAFVNFPKSWKDGFEGWKKDTKNKKLFEKKGLKALSTGKQTQKKNHDKWIAQNKLVKKYQEKYLLPLFVPIRSAASRISNELLEK